MANSNITEEQYEKEFFSSFENSPVNQELKHLVDVLKLQLNEMSHEKTLKLRTSSDKNSMKYELTDGVFRKKVIVTDIIANQIDSYLNVEVIAAFNSSCGITKSYMDEKMKPVKNTRIGSRYPMVSVLYL